MHIASTLKLQRNSQLILIPLVDLIFLLLIFFIIGSTKIFLPGQSISFPQSISPSPVESADKMVISFTYDRRLFVNDEQVAYEENGKIDWSNLEQKLDKAVYQIKSMYKKSTTASVALPVIILKIDKNTSINDLQKISSIARRYSQKVIIPTTPAIPK